MIDIVEELNAIRRDVARRPGDEGEVVSVQLSRTYPASAEDIWDALTDPDRLKRWFLPISGELQVGGRFQLEGNAGGEILQCEPPKLLRVTFGGETSLVELRLSTAGEGETTLDLEHTVPIELAGSGAGALYVGPGWDGGLLALSLHVQGEVIDDPVAAASSPAVLEFSRQSVDAWAAAVEKSNTASADELAAAVEVGKAQFGGGAMADALSRTDQPTDDPA